MIRHKYIASIVCALLLIPALGSSAVTTAKDKKADAASKAAQTSSSSSTRQFSTQTSLADGTIVSITVVAPLSMEGKAQSSMSAALSRIASLDRDLFSTDGLESRLNALPKGQSLEVSPDAFAMLTRAVELAALTGGWFDIAAPSPKNWIVQRDSRRIALNASARTVSFKSDGMKVDLSKVSRGYMADLGIEELTSAGFSNAMVEVGPIARNVGRDIFTPWNVQIGFGASKDKYASRALSYSLSNIALATVTSDGLGLNLTDPKSKALVSNNAIQSITILAADATAATAYALAAYTLGPKIGLRYVESHPEIRGIVVDSSGNLFASAGLGTANAKPLTAEVEIQSTPDGGPNDLKQKEREEDKDL